MADEYSRVKTPKLNPPLRNRKTKPPVGKSDKSKERGK